MHFESKFEIFSYLKFEIFTFRTMSGTCKINVDDGKKVNRLFKIKLQLLY